MQTRLLGATAAFPHPYQHASIRHHRDAQGKKRGRASGGKRSNTFVGKLNRVTLAELGRIYCRGDVRR
ncbi:hypothetical protein VYU27_007471 [Nannochloropsis oceanica]